MKMAILVIFLFSKEITSRESFLFPPSLLCLSRLSLCESAPLEEKQGADGKRRKIKNRKLNMTSNCRDFLNSPPHHPLLSTFPIYTSTLIRNILPAAEAAFYTAHLS